MRNKDFGPLNATAQVQFNSERSELLLERIKFWESLVAPQGLKNEVNITTV